MLFPLKEKALKACLPECRSRRMEESGRYALRFKSMSHSDSRTTKALGYALVTELDGLDLRIYKRGDVTPPDVRVTVNGADLRLHLAADTGGVLGAFIGSFSSIFASPSDTP